MEQFKQLDEHSSWEDKTDLLAGKVGDFWATYTKNTSLGANREKYDEVDFHISGVGLTSEMRNGTLLPNKVEVFYRDGNIKKIKATYKVDNLTEVFISGKALEDFLSQA
jgi:hypothetical protein